jgi:MerR family transcriptional regulator, copper efflux regulator
MSPNADPPLACTLTSSDYRQRADQWREMLSGTTSEWTADGAIRTTLPLDRLPALAELIAAETRCCPFLSFHLTMTTDGVQLDTHAPADARPLLDHLFPDVPPAGSTC